MQWKGLKVLAVIDGPSTMLSHQMKITLCSADSETKADKHTIFFKVKKNNSRTIHLFPGPLIPV